MGFPLERTPDRVNIRMLAKDGEFHILERARKGWEPIDQFDNRHAAEAFLEMKLTDKLYRWSLGVKIRDHFTCICGELDRTLLESHHIKPKAMFPDLMYDLDNGKCTCLWLHAIEHKDDPRIRDRILARLATIIFPRFFPQSVKVHGMIEV